MIKLQKKMFVDLTVFSKEREEIYSVYWSQNSSKSKLNKKLILEFMDTAKQFYSRTVQVDGSDNFVFLETDGYRFSHYHTGSNLEFIGISSLELKNIDILLEIIYSQCFSEYIVKNPLCDVGGPIKSSYLDEAIAKQISAHVNNNMKNIG